MFLSPLFILYLLIIIKRLTKLQGATYITLKDKDNKNKDKEEIDPLDNKPKVSLCCYKDDPGDKEGARADKLSAYNQATVNSYNMLSRNVPLSDHSRFRALIT